MACKARFMRFAMLAASYRSAPTGGVIEYIKGCIFIPLWHNIHTMKFYFDAEKSASNHKKHGIDFYDAQALWKDPDHMDFCQND